MAQLWWRNLHGGAAGGVNFSANNWNDVVDGSGTWQGPGTTNDLTYDAGVFCGNCTVDVASACSSIGTVAYANTLTVSNDLDVNGNAALEGTIDGVADLNIEGTITISAGSTITAQVVWDGSGAKNITYNAVQIPLEVNGSSTLTAQDDGYWASFTMTAGTYASGGFAHNAYGAVTYTAGTCTGLSLVAQAALTLIWGTTTSVMGELDVNAQTITSGGSIYTKTLTGSGTLSMAHEFRIFAPGQNDFWTYTGTTIGGGAAIIRNLSASRSNTAAINFGTKRFEYRGVVAGEVLTLNGGLTCDQCLIWGSNPPTLVLGNNSSLTADNVLLGAATLNGHLDLGGTGAHAFNSLARNGTGTASSIDFGSGTVTLGTGNIDLTGIPTVDFASCSIDLNGNTLNGASVADRTNTAAAISNGTVQNLLIAAGSPKLNCRDSCTKSGTCARVTWLSRPMVNGGLAYAGPVMGGHIL